MLLIYHMVSSTILIQSPRFIPHSFGSLAERYVDALGFLVCRIEITVFIIVDSSFVVSS